MKTKYQGLKFWQHFIHNPSFPYYNNINQTTVTIAGLALILSIITMAIIETNNYLHHGESNDYTDKTSYLKTFKDTTKVGLIIMGVWLSLVTAITFSLGPTIKWISKTNKDLYHFIRQL